MGAQAHDEIKYWADEMSPGIAIEIGSEQGDGSTKWFAEFFKERNMEFHTIDIDEGAYTRVKEYANAHLGDYREVFKDFSNISFAYLDNFDYPPPGCEDTDWFLEIVQQYKEWGIELTMENSAQAHLEQAKFVHERASERAFIIFDDTFDVVHTTTPTHKGFLPEGRAKGYVYPETGLYGKGMYAVPWLLENGWRELDKHMEGRWRDDFVILCNF